MLPPGDKKMGNNHIKREYHFRFGQYQRSGWDYTCICHAAGADIATAG